jgi:hypothetical protein
MHFFSVMSHDRWKGGASQAAEKRSNTVILSPFAVILSAAKNLALPAQGKLREGSGTVIFQAMRDSSFARLRTACGSSAETRSVSLFDSPSLKLSF